MNAQEIIEYIRTSEKKTPVKVYVWEQNGNMTDFPNCHVFPGCSGAKIVFGDWKDVAPVLQANEFEHVEIENNCRNSAIPMLDMKNIPARIEPGAIIREQVEIGKNAVIMMGAILTFTLLHRVTPRSAICLISAARTALGRRYSGMP